MIESSAASTPQEVFRRATATARSSASRLLLLFLAAGLGSYSRAGKQYNVARASFRRAGGFLQRAAAGKYEDAPPPCAGGRPAEARDLH